MQCVSVFFAFNDIDSPAQFPSNVQFVRYAPPVVYPAAFPIRVPPRKGFLSVRLLVTQLFSAGWVAICRYKPLSAAWWLLLQIEIAHGQPHRADDLLRRASGMAFQEDSPVITGTDGKRSVLVVMRGTSRHVLRPVAADTMKMLQKCCQVQSIITSEHAGSNACCWFE